MDHAPRREARRYEGTSTEGHARIVRGSIDGDQPVIGSISAIRVTREGAIGETGAMVRSATAPAELDEPTADTEVTEDRPWIVLVWNDPINLMSYVAFVFQKLFGYSKDKAHALMLDVHHKGRAVVSSGPREKAELDVFRLHEHGLWATMQRDDS
jgi:ATP-dependent Clp protease adaptor protein ClpS